MADDNQIVEMTAEIVSAHVANNTVALSDMPHIIENVHRALAALSGAAGEEDKKSPAVSIRASVKPDYLVCMECGRKQKVLKRHLRVAHGMTPEQYRKDYGLPDNYPMAAPNYSERRRETAKKILGRKTKPAPAVREPRRKLRVGEADQIALRQGTH